jgi:hypothetical protein
MTEFLVNINPADGKKARGIVKELQKGGVIPEGAQVYVGADSSIAVTRPPTARVEQVFSDPDSGEVSTVRITS